MKISLLFTALFFSFSNLAFSCENPAKERDLHALFYTFNRPTNWKSVRGKSFKKDRGTRVTVYARDSIASSRVDFKGKVHRLDQVRFCLKGSSNVSVFHPEHGELLIRRFKRGLDSYILLSKGLFSLRLRPASVVED